MKKTIKTVLAGLLVVPMLALGISLATPVAQSVSATSDLTTDSIGNGAKAAQGTGVATDLFGGTGSVFTTITNTALFIIGALSVIMLIYGGIRYTISAGDAKNVEAAKNTILYAIIGVVVSVLAYAIINFVITKLTTA